MDRKRLLSSLIIFYMLLALAWWSILLFSKNRNAFEAQAEILRYELDESNLPLPEDVIAQEPAYEQLAKKHKRQTWMIIGEGLMFGLSLIGGIWFIYRAHSAELRASERQKNFLLSITHELKSPIASIRLILQTFLKRQLEKAKADKLYHNALEETERLEKLVNNLLLSARLEGAYQPVMESADISAHLMAIVDGFRDKYPVHTIEFHSEQAPLQATYDREAMRSVFDNLLENAIKYGGEDGRTHVSIQKRGMDVAIRIADQGMGIPDSERERIFQKFYRMGSEETRRSKGTGLGLFIVREIVRSHQGHVEVLPNQPKGSIFEVVLPIGKHDGHAHSAR